MEDSIIVIDRGYSTDEEKSKHLPLHLTATCKRARKFLAYSSGRRPADGQIVLLKKGRSLLVFRKLFAGRKPLFEVDYRDISNHRRSVHFFYYDLPAIARAPFSLEPRNRVSWRLNVNEYSISAQTYWNLKNHVVPQLEESRLGRKYRQLTRRTQLRTAL